MAKTLNVLITGVRRTAYYGGLGSQSSEAEAYASFVYDNDGGDKGGGTHTVTVPEHALRSLTEAFLGRRLVALTLEASFDKGPETESRYVSHVLPPLQNGLKELPRLPLK